jgi:hypothetical protein
MKQLIRPPRVSILAGMMNPDLRARSLAAVAFVKRGMRLLKKLDYQIMYIQALFFTSNGVKNATY